MSAQRHPTATTGVITSFSVTTFTGAGMEMTVTTYPSEEKTLTAIPHSHGYVRVRQLPTLLVRLASLVGLGRLVVESGELPHHPDCTDEIGVLEETE